MFDEPIKLVIVVPKRHGCTYLSSSGGSSDKKSAWWLKAGSARPYKRSAFIFNTLPNVAAVLVGCQPAVGMSSVPQSPLRDSLAIRFKLGMSIELCFVTNFISAQLVPCSSSYFWAAERSTAPIQFVLESSNREFLVCFPRFESFHNIDVMALACRHPLLPASPVTRTE
jgi:hypothetical protein